jgi:hypothetical protein
MKKFTLQLYAAKRNLLFALFFFSTLVASSQTFYVNDNSTVGDVYTSAVGNDSNPGTASAPFATIQAAIAAATSGDVINVDAGTYNETLTVDKLLTIDGAGSAGETHVNGSITINASGTNATVRLVVKDLSVTNTASGGVGMTIGAGFDHIELNNVKSSNNAATGVSIAGGATTEGLVFTNCVFNDNGTLGSGTGIRMGAGVNIDGFTITGGEVKRNAQIGFSYNSSTSAVGLTNLTIDGTVFEKNGVGMFAAGTNTGSGDISLFSWNGNATLNNVSVIGGDNAADAAGAVAVQFRGSNTPAPSGTITVTGLSITGHYKRIVTNVANPLAYGIFLANYNNVSNISLSNVVVNIGTGHALSVAGLSNTLQLGNTSLNAQGVGYAHILNGTSTQNNVLTNVNGTGATFGGVAAASATLAQNFVIEDKLLHSIDNPALGFVRVKNAEVFVTANSFISPTTTTPSIQRGVNAATAGDVVNVATGTFTENVTIAKRLSIIGAGSSLAGTVVQGVGGAGDVFTYTTASGISGTPSSLEKMYLTGAAKGVYLGTNDYINLDDLDLVGLSSYGVELINNNNINITNSVFTSGASGIRLGTTANANTLFINGCTFSTNSEQAIHSFASATGGLTNVTITNNTITNCGVTNNMSAMYFEKLSNANISSNTITNTGVSTNPRGIVLNMKTSAYSNVTIENNILTENRTAVASLAAGYAIRFAGFSGGSLSGINVLGNNIDGYRTAVEYGAAVDRSTIQIKNNLVNNVQLGVLSYSGTSSSSTQINDNSFTNLVTGSVQTPIPSPFAILNADAAGTSVAATCNWYGTTASGSIASKIFGPVTYSPWLVNGTDNNLVTSGFQPVSGSCTGTSVVIASAVPAGGCDIPGSITVTFSGGVGPYNIAWTGGSASGVTSPYTITGLANGSYTATVTDANGSSATSDTVTVLGATSVTYYADADGDGFGNAAISVVDCVQPVNYVTNSTDCNDANGLVWRTASFYVDADADGYSPSASSEILCYGATTPSGYAVGTLGLDCDDMIAAVNPGHVEVLYNGIDDNCDGQLDEGNQAKTTLQSVSCGATLSSIGSLIYANINYSATGYRFKVVDNSQHWFALNWLASYDYATAYTISVQLQIASVWVGYYGTTCVVNTPDITTPIGSLQLISTQCGATLPSIATVIYTTAQSGATGYRFRITDVTVGATGANLVQEKDRSYHWFTLPMLTRYNYGSTYMVEVAVKTTGGYTGYGSPCYVYTPASPMLNNCGAVIPTSRTLVYTAITKSVTQYRFQVTKVSDQTARTFDTGRFWFSFKVNMPGYTPSVAYSVRVAVMTAGTWSPFGDACEIISPAIPRTDINAELDFTANAFPNPYTDQFNLLVNTDSDELISYRVYDMLGKLIEADEFDYTALETKEFGRNYPAGVYNVIVTQGENMKTLRMIKR